MNPQLTHMFFSDDGSTAVEVGLKLAVQYFLNLGRTEKHELVALAHGYHGDTAGAMSVSDESPFTKPFDSMRYPVHRVNSAYCYRCPVGLKREIVPHRMRESTGRIAERAWRKDRRGDCRTAIARRGRHDRSPGRISAKGPCALFPV